MIITVFSGTLRRALILATVWLACLFLLSVTIHHFVPWWMLLWYCSGPNIVTILKAMPVVQSAADLVVKIHHAIPRLFRSLVEYGVISPVIVLGAILGPSSLLAWTTTAALGAALLSAYWLASGYLRSLWKSRGVTVTAAAGRPLFLFEALVATLIAALVLLALFYSAPQYVDILVGRIGETQCLACIVFAACISAFWVTWVNFLGEPLPGHADQPADIWSDAVGGKELTHVQLTAVMCAVLTIVCMVVSDINQLLF